MTDRLMFDVASSLTDRDRHILRLIRWHRVLTTSQVQMMFFSDRNTAQHRMTRLYQLRLVERFRPPHAGREAEYHYVLDRLGAFVVAVMALPDLDREIKVRWRTDQALAIATSQRLAHTVGANDLFVRLIAAGRHNPDAELVTWWSERYCKANLGEVVRPDGVGVWRERDAVVTFCLEYDRGTEPLARIRAKADDYARLERPRASPFGCCSSCPVRAASAVSGRRWPAPGWRWPLLPGSACKRRRAPCGRRSTPRGPGCGLGELAGWPRPAASIARVAEAARLRVGGPAFEGR